MRSLWKLAFAVIFISKNGFLFSVVDGKPMKMPCGDGFGNAVDCPPSNDMVRLVVKYHAEESSPHKDSFGMYTVRLVVEPTAMVTTGCRSCELYFTNKATGKRIAVDDVWHWSWGGNELYFHPIGTAANVNAIFSAGDIITVQYRNEVGRDVEMPCTDGSGNAVDCSHGGDPVRLVLNTPAVQSPSHTYGYGKYTVRLVVEPTVTVTAGCRSCKLYFTNKSTGRRIAVDDVMHWTWAGDKIYFHPVGTAADVNAIFNAGDTITVQRRNEEGKAFKMPCGDGTGNAVRCLPGNDMVRLVVDSLAVESPYHTRNIGKYTVRLVVEPTVMVTAGCRDCQLYFANKSTGRRIAVDGVWHWSYAGREVYFHPIGTAADVNDIFSAGGIITVQHRMGGTDMEMPCGDGTGNAIDCPPRDDMLRLVVKDPAVESSWHTQNLGKYTVRLVVEPTVMIRTGCRNCSLCFLNEATGKRIAVDGVWNWSYLGREVYFHPKGTAADVNAIFSAGDIITVVDA